MIRQFQICIRWALCVVISSVPVFAQQEVSHYIGLGFGGSDFHLKDVHASPLIFRGLGITPSIQYCYRGEESRQYVECSYFRNDLETSSDNFQTKSWRGRFRYGFLQAVGKFNFLNNAIELFAGGSLQSFFSKAEYFFTVPPSGSLSRSIASWYWSHSLDVAGALEYTVGPREFLSIQLAIPLVSNVSRPQYSPSGDYNYYENDWKIHAFGETEFVPRNFSIDLLIMYQRPFIAGLNLYVSYEFYSTSYDTPGAVAMYMNNFRAGISLCL